MIVGAALRAIGDANPGGLALDFGAGIGIFSGVVSARSDLVVALDRVPGMATASQASTQQLEDLLHAWHFDARLSRISHIVGDLDVLSPDANFRIILAISVLEYLDDPAGTAMALFERLEPGGALVVTLPDTTSLVRRIERPVNAMAVFAMRRLRMQRLVDRQYAALQPHRVDYASLIRLLGDRAESATQHVVPLGLRGVRKKLGTMTMIVCHARGSG